MKRSPALSLFSNASTFVHRSHPPDACLLLLLATVSRARQRHSTPEGRASNIPLSPQNAAAEASKLLSDGKFSQQPDSVAAFFKRYGFRDLEAKKLLSWNPRWLLLDVEKTLAPKFRAFEALGFDQSEVVHLVRSNPAVINHKLESVVSKIQLWRDLLGSKDVLAKVFKSDKWILGYSISKRIQPNTETLRECGVAGPKLTMILRWQPTLIVLKTDTLKALISRVEDLGVPRTSGMFPWALSALSVVSVKRFEMQMELLRGFGWSETDFLAAFRRSPAFMTGSSKSLQRKMEFLVNEAGCIPSFIAQRPVILTLSLEKRLIPRYQILAALKSRGFSTGKYKLSTYMVFSEKQFLDKCLLRHKDECPDLIESYDATVKARSAL